MSIEPTILTPGDTGHAGVWVYRYEAPQGPWRLSIATHAPPDSGKLSLGGFRIAPEERTSSPGFDSDREAIGLANGMEEKVYWSRLIGVGGPLARRDISRIVGGKCVMHPTPDARVGQPRDKALLDFAIASFRDCESRAGICITTGQDLGHGMLHDGSTGSLEYLNARFSGSVVADTSKPTGEGNFRLLVGMLRGAGIDVARATVGLVGCGNIGMHLVERLRERGSTILALESRADRRAELEAMGIRTWMPEQKDEFLSQPMDALCVNAAGNSLDAHALDVIARNKRLHVVCGSENLVMPDEQAGSESLRAAGKLYAPTELGGMMGYLTAVEEYLAHAEGVPFDVHTLFDAAEKLDEAGDRGVDRVLERKGKVRFEDAIREIYGRGGKA